MQKLDGRFVHAASDLNDFAACVHLTTLDRAAATGERVRPERNEEQADLLARKGLEHEARILAGMRARYGDALAEFDRPTPTRAGYAAAEAATVAAMARGAAVLYQPTFFDGTFLGRADFVRRVERPSAAWAWSYEVVETKTALSPKPTYIVQLCNYSEHVARIQGAAVASAAVILGNGRERAFRMDDYAAYYRRLKAAYLTAFANGDDAYPFEIAACETCAWAVVCAQRRDADDHLSLVAGIRREQIRKLEAASIATLGALALADAERAPRRMRAETFAHLRAQAREQHRFRAAGGYAGGARHTYAFRTDGEPGSGFARLPAPDDGDVFFDMEGDPLYAPGRGLEYLFGYYLPHDDAYVPIWATDPAEERRAFETFVDFVVARRAAYPHAHVYHYAPYETSALKRLMGRFGSREAEIDAFLRERVFVDLYPVVHQGVYVSQPSYSIKKLEALYGFTRATKTKAGDDSIVMFESWLATQDPAILEDIRAYNEDDCRSTWALREWLVRLRAEHRATLAEPYDWFAISGDVAPPIVVETEDALLAARLLAGLEEPASDEALRTAAPDARGRWLAGNLVSYHRREAKPAYWEWFARIDDQADLVDGDTKALGGLRFEYRTPPYKLKPRDRNLVYTFAFPSQEFGLGNDPTDPRTQKGVEIVRTDENASTICVKLPEAVEPTQLRALIPGKPLPTKAQRAATAAIAEALADGTLADRYPATHALLLGLAPRMRGVVAGGTIQPPVVSREAVSAAIAALERSYLVVQGPPGTGKSTVGAHAIVDALASGKRVALAAQSHKALHSLLAKIEATAAARGFALRACHKGSSDNADSVYAPLDAACVDTVTANARFGDYRLVSATNYEWANAVHRGTFDLVVVDEAGQVGLADALVTSLVARDVVLLGDPQQLPNVSQGTHPLGVDRSILEHLLGGAATIAADRGIFLDTSYRMHPAIAAFVSHGFYDDRLHADAPNANNAVGGEGPHGGGLRFVAVEHVGNARRSAEEAAAIVAAIARLLATGTVAIRERPSRPLTEDDIIVVTPYNAQRTLLVEHLRRAGFPTIRVGTVDKFQGQEAPVVFYSLATSDVELAPRGLDFLLSPHRLNVAISRAQALAVVVCSPRLLAARAGTLEDMRLVNLLCAFAEAATEA